MLPTLKESEAQTAFFHGFPTSLSQKKVWKLPVLAFNQALFSEVLFTFQIYYCLLWC